MVVSQEIIEKDGTAAQRVQSCDIVLLRGHIVGIEPEIYAYPCALASRNRMPLPRSILLFLSPLLDTIVRFLRNFSPVGRQVGSCSDQSTSKGIGSTLARGEHNYQRSA